MVDKMKKAMAREEETLPDEIGKSFADYQATMFEHCKTMVKHAQEMVLKSDSDPEVIATSRKVVTTYSQLVESVRGALATIESAEVW